MAESTAPITFPEETIASLNFQTFKDYNLIVVDNLSEDKTVKKIKENFKG